MRLSIFKEKGPIGRKCEHWASFLGTRNRLSNACENSFPGGHGLSLLDTETEFIHTFHLICHKEIQYQTDHAKSSQKKSCHPSKFSPRPMLPNFGDRPRWRPRYLPNCRLVAIVLKYYIYL